MEKLISIIVAAYNMENYLQKCLSSLIVDDIDLFNLLDVLIINDGSKDRTSVIAHSFEKDYPEVFHVIDKKNGNYGSCINAALPYAKGKYVKILDADDYFDTAGFVNYLKMLKDIDADLILNDKITVDAEYKKTGEQIIPIAKDSVIDFDIVSKCWDAIDMHKMAYRKTLLINMNYKQTEGISYSDVEWMIKPFVLVNKVYSSGVNLYCYLQGRTGQTIDKFVRRNSFRSLHIMIISIAQYWRDFAGDNKRKQLLHSYLVYSVINIYREFFFETHFDKAEFKKFDTVMALDYAEIIRETDAHLWVSFIPNLKLAEDWRHGRHVKFLIEYNVIRLYLKLSALVKTIMSFFQ